jgi:hypothetical protein
MPLKSEISLSRPRQDLNLRPPPLPVALYQAELRGRMGVALHFCSLAEVIIPPRTVITTRAQAALLESCVPNRMGKGHCDRASPEAPCSHARRGIRV